MHVSLLLLPQFGHSSAHSAGLIEHLPGPEVIRRFLQVGWGSLIVSVISFTNVTCGNRIRKAMMTTTILTGVDNTETALRAAEKAAALAAAFDAELHVLSAYSVSMEETVRTAQSTNDPATTSAAIQKIFTQYTQNAERTAATVVDALRLSYPELKIVSKAREGSPAAALVREAKELGADIIVVGNKRVQGITRFLGSIARTVATEATCDLYIVNTRHR